MSNGAKIKVVDSVHCETTRYGTGEWDADDTVESHYITSFKVAEEKDYYDFQCSIADIEYGKLYYLVYVNYDTGDSFGNSDGLVSFVDLFEDRQLADKLAELITINANNYGNRTSYDYSPLIYTVDNGETRECSTYTWLGYFEIFNGVEVIELYRAK